MKVLHPPRDWPGSLPVNESSLTVHVAWPGLSVLFPGDAEEIAEGALAETGCEAQIIKVPHHGSRTSSSRSFIEAVRPEAVISQYPYLIGLTHCRTDARLSFEHVLRLRADAHRGSWFTPSPACDPAAASDSFPSPTVSLSTHSFPHRPRP